MEMNTKDAGLDLTFTVTKKKILAIRLFSRLRRDFLLLCFFLYFL